MKSSNVLLGLWFLVVAGLCFGVVYFFLQGREPDGGKPVPAPVVAGDPAQPKPLPTEKTPKPRTNRPAPVKAVPEIRGRVVDAEKKPVAGVEVLLLPPAKPVAPPPVKDAAEIRRVSCLVEIPTDEAESPRPLAAWVTIVPDPNRVLGEPYTQTVSGDDGAFLLSVPPAAGTGPFRVVARSASLGTASRSELRNGAVDVELVLATAGIVTGTVLSDATNAPVASCRLAFAGVDREFTTETDASGAFRIENMPAGNYDVRAGAEGHVPLLSKRVQVERGAPVEIRLPRGGTLRVTTVVSDAEGRKRREDMPRVPNAEVVALEEQTYAFVTGRTDANGFVEFTGLPEGVWLVNGRAADVIPVGDERTIVKPTDPVRDVIVEFEPAVLTTVEVVDEDGQPVAGMEWFAGNPDSEYDVVLSEKLPGATDDRGRFPFAFEFMGRRARIFGFRSGFAVVSVEPDDYTEGGTLRVVARKAGRLTGVVRNPAGQPIPGATVTVELTRPRAAAGTAKPGVEERDEDCSLRILAGPDGRFAFENLPVGFEAIVDASSPDGFYSDDFEDFTVAGEHEVKLTIDPTPKMRGMSIGNPGKAPATPPKSPERKDE